ncbi:DUF1501 domain-containing protein [Tautonia sociabilis]|uniref:DUF1501 domain-containing protein n=1 Tax=Tautonia sociabilis TaxID=2080755 RepID=A0A432MK64_9BACT|nr:DUF1501 domain-containing protein [Tautonia sociabilis]RUL87516.1 DUF1501 domain-containing protein [Tautonia sociabilis]
MFGLDDRPNRLCDGLSRREWLRVGGLSVLGLGLDDLLRAGTGSGAGSVRAAASPLARGLDGATFGRAKNVIYLWLQGGPPQHETFDPKPDAPLEIRGPFQPIATNIPGIHFSELLPRTARRADRLAVVRSIATDDPNHDVSGYWVLTGYPYGPGSARQIKPSDWPYFGSIVKMLRPSEELPALSTVWIPDLMRLNDSVTPAGQTAGFLGRAWEPERFVGDPAAPDYRIEGLDLPTDLPRLRVDRRRALLGQLDGHLKVVERSGVLDGWDRNAKDAYDLVSSGKARAAFDLSREPDAVRDRYGRYSWGQTVLLARRLIEAGVRLVHVNWTREPGDSAVDNPMWDTHAQNADRLQDVLCPQFDVTFTALLDDLESRGLLDETLVVAIGEFGRTPKINSQGGRDHWGNVFSFVMAGAGISGGQVFGASDRDGALPASDPIRPHDLTATIFHLLGIDHLGTFPDKLGRPQPITRGEPIAAILGDGPATADRCEPGGDVAFVPPFDDSLLLDTDFSSGRPPIAVAPPTREKGWRGWPLNSEAEDHGLVVRVLGGERRGALLGLAPGGTIPAGSRAMLAQEIRSARGGEYTFSVSAAMLSGDQGEPEADLLALLSCRLVLFRFADASKDPRSIQELASLSFRPEPGAPRPVTLQRFLGSTQGNVNFPIGQGLGVAIILENSSGAPINLGHDSGLGPAGLLVSEVSLSFRARPRNENTL